MSKTIVHLLSGGLDSVTMLYHLNDQGHRIHCLLFDYKQQHVQELQCAILHARRLGLLWTKLELPALHGLTEENWIVPNRNAIMLSMAVNVAVQAGADTITIGCNADDADYFPDCRKAFLDSLNSTVQAAGYNIEICAPFLDWGKWKIAALAQDIGIKATEIWTCYRGGAKPCGECPACQKLEVALVK